MCSRRKRSSDNERRPPAAKIQPGLDFSYGALGGGAADSWNSFLFAAGGSAPERLVARSSDTFSCRAADLSGGADRRHRQVAYGGEFRGRAAQLRSERAVLHQRAIRRALSAFDN